MKFVAKILSILLLAGLTSCGPTSKNALAPPMTASIASQIPGAYMTQIMVDGKLVNAWVKPAPKFGTNDASYVKLYICDGPLIGPQLDGHCSYDGSLCSSVTLQDLRGYGASADPDISNLGDPTADDAQTTKGDGDATVIR